LRNAGAEVEERLMEKDEEMNIYRTRKRRERWIRSDQIRSNHIKNQGRLGRREGREGKKSLAWGKRKVGSD